MKNKADAVWSELANKRRTFMGRLEKYAGWTLPRLLTPGGFDPLTEDLRHDWQAVGAQSVNHVVNKMVLSLFAPSRPFMRLEADPQWKAAQLAQGLEEAMIDDALATAEQRAVKELDRRGDVRSKLYVTLSNLVALGNALVYLPPKNDEDVRCFSIRTFAVRRTGSGKVKTLVTKEEFLFDELEVKVQDTLLALKKHYKPDTKVAFYRLIQRNRIGGYEMTQWVDGDVLPKEYNGAWSEDDMPYRVLTWNLKDGSDYGTGLVEDYAGDFAALSALSEAQIKGAILASEFRWLVNPSGMTKPEDLEDSENGAAIPGLKDDISLVTTSKGNDIAQVQSVAADYIQRIGRGFLLGSTVTRQAERVTAEEIRMQATELETSFGGTYSRVAVDMQLPVARWLLKSIDLSLKNTKLELSIITGLDALSRSGDLDNLRAAIADLSGLQALGQVAGQLNINALVSTIFAGHGLSASKYVKSPQQAQADQQAQQAQERQAEIDAASAQAGAAAGAEQAAQQGM